MRILLPTRVVSNKEFTSFFNNSNNSNKKSRRYRSCLLLVCFNNNNGTTRCLLLCIIILVVVIFYNIMIIWSSFEQNLPDEVLLLLLSKQIQQQELQKYQQQKLLGEPQQQQQREEDEVKVLLNVSRPCTKSRRSEEHYNKTIIYEYGKSSCFGNTERRRTRMVYPLSMEENGCYLERDLPHTTTTMYDPDDLVVVLNNNNRSYCRFLQLIINVSNIYSVRYGGENYLDVIGQDETNEILSFGTGTFITRISNEQYNKLQSENKINNNFLFGNNTVIQQQSTDNNNIITSQCSHTIPGTSVFVRRKDYVNLFHAMTNWFNIWLAIDSINAQQLRKEKQILNITNLIFLDAHPIGHLDDVWSTLFTNYTYMQHYKKKKHFNSGNNNPALKNTNNNTLVCFDDAVFVPDEIYNDIFHAWVTNNSKKECPDRIVMNRFIHYVLDKFNCSWIVPKPYHIIYIDRKPYRSHARSKITNIDRRIRNFDTAAKTIQSIIATTMNITSTYEVVRFENYTMRQQIEIIRSATVVFGYHGAALTHMIFMSNHTTVIEIDHTRSNNLFGTVHNWMGNNQTIMIHRHVIPELDGSRISDDYITEHIIPVIQQAFTRCI